MKTKTLHFPEKESHSLTEVPSVCLLSIALATYNSFQSLQCSLHQKTDND